jgi:hypothetical protein
MHSTTSSLLSSVWSFWDGVCQVPDDWVDGDRRRGGRDIVSIRCRWWLVT